MQDKSNYTHSFLRNSSKLAQHGFTQLCITVLVIPFFLRKTYNFTEEYILFLCLLREIVIFLTSWYFQGQLNCSYPSHKEVDPPHHHHHGFDF